MDSFSSFNDISALSTMLQESREASEGQAVNTQPPQVIGGTRVITGAAGSSSDAKKGAAMKDSKTIWKVEELPTEDSVVNTQDDRPCPRYEISYKQQVGTCDTFLGTNDLTPASADCSHLIVKIHFPGCTMQQLDLDVTKERIKAESKTHRLFTYLPTPVDKDKGTAKFDSKKEVLIVTLPILKDSF